MEGTKCGGWEIDGRGRRRFRGDFVHEEQKKKTQRDLTPLLCLLPPLQCVGCSLLSHTRADGSSIILEPRERECESERESEGFNSVRQGLSGYTTEREDRIVLPARVSRAGRT